MPQPSRRRFLEYSAGLTGFRLLDEPLNMLDAAPRRLAILDAPSNLGLKPSSPGVEPGVRKMPRVLRTHNLLARLRSQNLTVEDVGTTAVPPYQPAIETATGVRNAGAIHAYSIVLAGNIQELVAHGRFPLVLGGDCSILLGSTLALRRLGRYGLLFIDGHTDLLTPQTSQSHGAAGMDLALATGTGPDLLTNIEALRPYVRPADTIVFGYRVPDGETPSPLTPQPPMTAIPLRAVRSKGAAEAASAAVRQLESLAGFWVHVDLDVLDPEFMPAVDSQEPGGMKAEELTAILQTALRSKRCVGLECTIYDPTLDPTGVGAERIVQILADAFQGFR